MAEPTLTDVFGAGASQTATQLIIDKADLASHGLTPAADNTAESLYVAMTLQAADFLTTTNQETNPEQQIVVEQSTIQSLVTRGTSQYRQVSFTVDLQTPDIAFTLDPDQF